MGLRWGGPALWGACAVGVLAVEHLLPTSDMLPSYPTPAAARRSLPRNAGMGNGVFTLLLLNFALFAAQSFVQLPVLALLPLNHWRPVWWQFVTCTFMHANWEHLSSNAFSLLVFGRMGELLWCGSSGGSAVWGSGGWGGG